MLDYVYMTVHVSVNQQINTLQSSKLSTRTDSSKSSVISHILINIIYSKKIHIIYEIKILECACVSATLNSRLILSQNRDLRLKTKCFLQEFSLL